MGLVYFNLAQSDACASQRLLETSEIIYLDF